MPDDPKPPPPHPPIPIPEELIRELDGEAWHVATLAQLLAQTLQFWADPDRPPPFLLEHGRPPVPPRPGMTAEEAVEEARGVLESLHHARAILEGATSPTGRDQRALVRLVEEIEGEIARIPAGRSVPIEALVDAVLPDFRWQVSESTWQALQEPNARAQLASAASIKAGLVRPEVARRGRPRAKGARWLEPLFLVALNAGLTEARDAASWGGTLRYLGFLPKKEGLGCRKFTCGVCSICRKSTCGICRKFTCGARRANSGHTPSMRQHDPHNLRRIAVAAHVDPRTVAKVLSGQPTKSLASARVRAVIKAEGLPMPSSTPSRAA